MRQITKILLPFIFSLLLCACGNGDKIIDPPPVNLENELFSLVYSSYKWPDGFYTEELSGGNIYYENTVSTKPVNKRNGSWIELSSNDKNTAKQWSEASASYSAYYRDIVSESENEKYFEFRRVYSSNPSDILLSRVHKSSYLDRTMYDFSSPNTNIGKFKKPGFTKNDVKELIEYLWFVWHYNNGSSKVHRTELTESASEYLCTIYEIQITYGDWGMKDVIKYLKHTYSIDKASGGIYLQTQSLKEFNGRG